MDETEVAAPLESAPAVEVEHVESQPDAPATSSPAGGSDDSPTSPEETEKAEFISELAKARGETKEAETAETPEQTETPEQEVPEATEKPEVKADDLSQSESEIPKPFTDRPEWQSLTKFGDRLGKTEGAEVRKTLRTLLERETNLVQEVERSRPHVAVVTDLIKEVGTEQGFRNLVSFIKQSNADPATAVPMFEKLLADARQRAGLVIQSPDLLTQSQKLDQLVRDGEMTQEQADQRRKELTELEASRANTKRTASQTEQQRRATEQTAVQERQRAEFASIDQAERDWTIAKSKSDPDYKMVEPLFIKFAQLGATEFKAENRRNPNPADAKQILEKAYTDAKAEALKFRPRRAAITPTRDTGTSRNTRQQPMTEAEQFKADLEAARKRNS
jgi:hypothetical protein